MYSATLMATRAARTSSTSGPHSRIGGGVPLTQTESELTATALLTSGATAAGLIQQQQQLAALSQCDRVERAMHAVIEGDAL